MSTGILKFFSKGQKNFMATIIDVAKLADVSKSTVSRVVSGNGYVSPEARQKVLAAMEELSYTPNLLARQLRSGKTKTIGFVSNGYGAGESIMLAPFIKIAQEYNYSVVLFFTGGDKKREVEVLNQLKYKQVDALFLFTRFNSWDVIEAYTIYGPIATRHRIDSTRIYSSYFDHYDGYLMTLDYLYSQGYRRIGHVLGRKENLNTQARLQAIHDFYEEKGLSDEPWIYHDNHARDFDQRVVQEFREIKPKLEAISFYYDTKAAGFICEMENQGFSIPEDVAVIGFDNAEISRLMHITSVDYSITHQAENSFLYIYNQLQEETLPEKPIEVKLVERKTTPKYYDRITDGK